MSDKAKVGRFVLNKVSDEKNPEHYLWKRALEQDWAGECTLAGLTGYRYRMGLDPSFIEELPEFKRGQIHRYEWILCKNGGIIYFYSQKIFRLLTTKKTADRILAAGLGAKVDTTQDDRLSHVIHFPAAEVMEVCKLAGARRAKPGRPMKAEQKKAAQIHLDKVRPTSSQKAA